MGDYEGPRSSIRYPLDFALGSEAQVRLLRVLAAHESVPLSVSDATRLAGLTAAGARRALDRLRNAGFVRRVGSGHALQYEIRDDAAGVTALAQAFEAERDRFDRFIASLKEAVSMPEATAVWLERLPAVPSEAACLSAVVEVAAVPWIQDELRTRLIGVEREFDVIVEVSIYTRADEPSARTDAIPLWGVLPGSLSVERAPAVTHDAAVARGFLMSREIAAMVRRDPTLVERARRHVIRVLNEEQGMAAADLLEWRQLLESYTPERIADLLESESSRAERLRQSSPFFAVLTTSERDRLLERVAGESK